jgi:hypothetical protein
MRPCIEIDKYFIGGKKSIFTLNLLGRIPEKCMGRHVTEMDKQPQSKYQMGRVLPLDSASEVTSDRLSKFPLPGIEIVTY